MNNTVEIVTTVIVAVRQIVLTWFCFSLGLWKVLKKLGDKHAWRAWIPGLRYIAFGSAVERPIEGVITGLLEIAYFVVLFIRDNVIGESIADYLTIATAIALLSLYIYRVRMFLRLVHVFGAKKRWIVLWLFAEGICMMIFGFSKKLQPTAFASLAEEERGALLTASDAGKHQKMAQAMSGLSVDLRARTVRDFGKKRYLLRDIQLEIPNGSLVMLLGGSGAGKTTFLNAVIGYERADATILLNGENVYDDYARMKYRIGFVPQQNLIRGNDTVIRTVGDAAEMRLPSNRTHRERSNKIDEVLDLLGLTAGSGGLVSKKSGGQLRRISIAMELVSDPELFVLDEPDSGLDGAIAREIFQKLREIADSGKIVIVITHTPDRVVDLFDRVIVLAKDSNRIGRLAFYGPPQDARTFFGKDTMEQIVASINRKEEGGEGLADLYVNRFAELKEGAAQ